jgi:fibronectin type 3 domain-containing protein
VSYRVLPPSAIENVNDDNFRNGIGRGVATTINFVEGSVGDVKADIIVFDQDTLLDEFYRGMKFRGCSWWPGPAGSGYGAGTGGTLNLRVCLCDAALVPRFTDAAARLCQELGVVAQTRMTEILATIGGWPGGDGPDWFPWRPRVTPGGAMAVMPGDVALAFCTWNSNTQPGLNYGSTQDGRCRQFVFPANYPGMSAAAAITGATAPGGGITTVPAGGQGYRDPATGRGRAANSFACTDKTSPWAIAGLDPRQHCRSSVNGGGTWPDNRVGVGCGYYGGSADPAADGVRLPWYGFRASGSSAVYPQPDYQPFSDGKTVTRTIAEDCTITEAGGFAQAGNSLGTLTVRHLRGGVQQGGDRTTSGGSLAGTSGGFAKGTLSSAITALAGDQYTVTASGQPMAGDSDNNTVLFGVTADRPNLWAIKSNGQAAEFSSTAAPDVTPPAAPTGVTAPVVTSTSVQLGWTPPADPDVASYNVERRLNGTGSYVKINAAPVPSASYTDNTVSQGTAYQYRMLAVDTSGNVSNPSTAAVVTTPTPDTTAPGAPAAPVGTPLNNAIMVGIGTPPNGEADLSGYLIDVSPNAGANYYPGLPQIESVPSSFPQGINAYSIGGTTTPIVNGTAYRIRLRAFDASGNISTPGAFVTVTPAVPPDVTPPAAPHALTLTALNLAVRVDETVLNTEPDVSYYLLDYKASASGTWLAYNGGEHLTAFPVTQASLTNGTPYDFRLRAVDTSGNISAVSATATTTPAAPPDTTPPAKPATPSLTPLAAAARITLVPPNAEPDLASYELQRKLSSEDSTHWVIPAGGAQIVAWPFTDAGRTNGVSLDYRVIAVDASGNRSLASDLASVTPAAAPDTTPPATPTGFAVLSVSLQAVNLTWNAQGEPDLQKYRLRRRVAGGTFPSPPTAEIQAPTHAYADTTGITIGVVYEYQLTAVDQSGNESGATATITAAAIPAGDLQPPAAPVGLAGVVTTANRVEWADSPEPDWDHYTLYRRVPGGAYSAVATGLVVSTYLDQTVVAGLTYEYVVSSVDSSGNESPLSGIITITPPDVAPGGGVTTLRFLPGETGGAVMIYRASQTEVQAARAQPPKGDPIVSLILGPTNNCDVVGLLPGTAHYAVVFVDGAWHYTRFTASE